MMAARFKQCALIPFTTSPFINLGDYLVPILVAYHLITLYYFYYLSITYYPMSIKWQ